MRNVLVFILVTVFTGNAFALELGNQLQKQKSNTHVGENPGQADSREGGEDFATAFPILSLPFYDTGNTLDNVDNYDAVCPYSGSTSPDVVYSFIPPIDWFYTVDLCGSLYDTKTYIFDSAGNLIDCNDDFYSDKSCGHYVSLIPMAPLNGGETYFIVIDGYGGDAGDYTLEVREYWDVMPCPVVCDGVAENEPPLGDGYVDVYNSGCNEESGLYPFQALEGDAVGELNFCGKAGWYGSSNRDTDWFTAVVGGTGMIEWTLDTEEEIYGFLLGPQDCSDVGVIDQILVNNCDPRTMTILGSPGDIVWLWVGPSVYTPPPGFDGHEFDYYSHFLGLEGSVTSTDHVSFDGIKCLYR